jgi:hypothetical protein
MAFVAVVLTLLAYGRGVRLPFYADDLRQIPWVKETPALDYWYRLGPYGDWRPLRFMLLRALYLTTGTLSPTLLHGLNLIGHMACGVLVGLLGSRWTKEGWATTALFITFPFATNVVLWVSAISYPLTTGLALTALLLYLKARERDHERDDPRLHLVALLFTLMAGLVYEGGIVTGAAVLWAELTLKERPYSRWALGHLAVSGALFIAITIFSTTVPTEFLTGLHPWYNIVALLQCIAYPVAPLATLGEGLLGMSSVTLMTLLGTLTLLGLALLNLRLGQLRGFLFALGWIVMWSVMPLTTQPFNWFRDPTRAFYQSSAGIALLWGITILGLARLRPVRWWRRGLAVALLLAALLPPLWFVRRVTAVHRMTGDLLWETIAAAEAQPDTLVVNLPGRVTPDERVYPLMHEGIIPIPPPTSGEIFVAAHTEESQGFWGRSLGAVIPELPYAIEPADPPLGPEDLRSASRVLLVRYAPTEMHLLDAGVIREGGADAELLATFQPGSGPPVVGIESAACRWTGPEEVSVEVTWLALGSVEGRPTVFTHWLGPTELLDTQADGEPLRGLYPLSSWQRGERISETRVLQGITAREGKVSLGIWNPSAGTRWQVRDAGGNRLPNDAFYLLSCEKP